MHAAHQNLEHDQIRKAESNAELRTQISRWRSLINMTKEQRPGPVSARFSNVCQVLDCSSPSARPWRADHPLDQRPVEVAVCDDHWAQLQGGSQWVAARSQVLMGDNVEELHLLRVLDVNISVEASLSGADRLGIMTLRCQVFGSDPPEESEVRLLVRPDSAMAIACGLLT